MHTSIKAIAGVYALLGAASALGWLYTVIHEGFDFISVLMAVWWVLIIDLAYGLVRFRPEARTLALVTSGLLGVVGVVGLIRWWQVHVRGGLKDAQGLIVERPVAALFLIALLIAFSAWQWWVFSRPQVRHLYSSKSA
jgi:hypothetical protein